MTGQPIVPKEHEEEVKANDVLEMSSIHAISGSTTLEVKMTKGGTDGPAANDHNANLYSQLAFDQACTVPLQVIGVQKASPISWSKDGIHLAFCALNHAIYICSVNEQVNPPAIQYQSTLVGHKSDVHLLEFHPKHPDLMISGGDEGMYVWNVRRGSIVQSIHEASSRDGHEGPVYCAKWLFGGSILATGSKDSNIILWAFTYDVDNTQKTKNPCPLTYIETLSGHKAAVLTLDGSDTTKWIFSAGRDSIIKKWDLTSLAPSVISRRDDDGSIKCGLLANMDGHRGDVVTLTCMKDGRMCATGARDNTIKLWDTVLHRCIRTISGHNADVRRLLFIQLPSGKTEEEKRLDHFMYSTSLDGTIKLYKLGSISISGVHGVHTKVTSDEDLERDREAADQLALEEILSGTMAAMTKTNGTNASLDRNPTIATDEHDRDELLMNFQASSNDICSMEICPTWPIIATSGVNDVKIWNASNLAQLSLMYEFVGHSEAVTSLKLINQDVKLISTSKDYLASIFDVQTMHRDGLMSIKGSILAMDVSPDEQSIFVAGNEYDIHRFHIGTNVLVEKYSGHAGRVYAIAINPEGNVMASAAHDYSICVWKIKSIGNPQRVPGATNTQVAIFSPRQKIQAHQGNVLGLAFNTDQQLLSCSNDHSIKVWKVKASSGKISLKTTLVDAHDSVVSTVAWGTRISKTAFFSGGWDQTIRVWTHSKNEPVAILKGHQGRLTALEISPDGHFLFSCSADGACFQWNAVQPYDLLCVYSGSQSGGGSISISVGAQIFATGFDDGIIKIWPIYDPGQEHAKSEPQRHFMTKRKFLQSTFQLSTS